MTDLTAIQTSPNKGSLLFICKIFEVDSGKSDKIKSMGGRNQEALLKITLMCYIIQEISISVSYCITP